MVGQDFWLDLSYDWSLALCFGWLSLSDQIPALAGFQILLGNRASLRFQDSLNQRVYPTTSSIQFEIIFLPCGVSTDSGWNCRPWQEGLVP